MLLMRAIIKMVYDIIKEAFSVMFYDCIETENTALTGKVKVCCIACYCFLMI